jgi:peptidoglycan/LPS O-acetylase OafA/YrhL
MKLSDYAHGRDNNFNLIRLLAAVTVLFSHCFPLASGTRSIEPFMAELNMSIGAFAVDLFFLTSGFLVSASLLARQNALEFVIARILRIIPGLWVMLLIVVVFLGGAMTSLPLREYLTSDMLIEYVVKCGTLVTGVVDYLPGVFSSNPFGSMVNIPLWTLPYELDMYGLLLVTWVLLALSGRRRAALFRYAMVAFSAVAGLLLVAGYFRHGLPAKFELHSTYAFPSLFYMFFTGAAFYVIRDRIELSGRLFCAAGIALLASVFNRHVFFVVYLFTVPYLLFYVAYVPNGKVRLFNRLGDYSYGVYIYGFPVQQTIIALVGGISILSLALIALPITLLLAILSWHLVEKRALSLKEGLGRRINSVVWQRAG